MSLVRRGRTGVLMTIVRDLGLVKETVRKFYRVAKVEDVLAVARDGRGRVLERYKLYLHERRNAGAIKGSQLFREIREQSYA